MFDIWPNDAVLAPLNRDVRRPMTPIGYPVVNPHAAENRRRTMLGAVHLLCAMALGLVRIYASYRPSLDQTFIRLSTRGGSSMALWVAALSWPYLISWWSISTRAIPSAARAAAVASLLLAITATVCAAELGLVEMLPEHLSRFVMSLVQALALLFAAFLILPE